MANLKGSSKREAYKAKVEAMDSIGSDIGDFDFKDDLNPLEVAAGLFIERVHENINSEKDMVTTGEISNIRMDVSGNELKIYGSPHLIYQDRGVNGSKIQKYDTPHRYSDKRPPLGVFIDWVKNKQLFLTDKNDYHIQMDDRLTDAQKGKERPFKELTEEEKIKRAAWAMREKVFKEGFRPRNLYSREIPQLVADVQELANAFALQQIVQMIDINPKDGGGKRIIIK